MIVLTVMFAFFSAPAFGQKVTGFIEIQADKDVPAQINLSVRKSIKEKIGVFAWALTSKTYSESYAGVTYSPKTWISTAIGVGVEDSKHPWVVGGNIWVGKKALSNFLVIERGGSGLWYKNLTSYQLRKDFKLALIKEKFKGFGPHAALDIPKTDLQVWSTLYFRSKQEGPLLQLGVKFKF